MNLLKIINPNQFRKSSGAMVLLLFFAFAMIFTLIFSLINLNRKEGRHYEELNQKLDIINDNFVGALTNSLWNFDDTQVKTILKGIVSNADIEQAKVYLENEQVFQMGSPVEEKYIVERTIPLVRIVDDGKSDYIGDLYIAATTKNFQTKLAQDLRFTLITEFFKIIFFLTIVFITMKFIITRHLSTITNFFYESNIYRSQKKLQLNRSLEFWKPAEDDFDLLVKAINQMIDRLHRELQQRRKSEDELKNLNENLEEMIERRTKQLLDSNRVEAVIEMASGIAHEINSPLSVVYALAKRFRKLGDNLTPEQTIDFSTKIETSANRIFSITNALHVLSVNALESKSQETNFREFMQSTVMGMSEIFRSTLSNIELMIDESIPKTMTINQSLFYQCMFSLLHLRHKDLDQNNSPWIRMEFQFQNSEIIWSCVDNGRMLTAEEQAKYLEPFKSTKEGQRGSNLILGTFSTLVNKLNAKIVFVPHNEDIFIQLRIPFEE